MLIVLINHWILCLDNEKGNQEKNSDQEYVLLLY